MTDDRLTEFRSDVPLPDDATARRIYAAATTLRTRFRVTRRVVLVIAAAAVGIGVAALVVKTPHASTPRGGGGIPPGYHPLALSFIRSGKEIASIAVTVNDPDLDSTLLLQVRRAAASKLLQAMNGQSEVVFEKRVPMSKIASPAVGPPGTVALSTWSGTLSPDSWAGGCQDSRSIYSVSVVGPSVGASSRWFFCDGSGWPQLATTSGPTGGSGTHG